MANNIASLPHDQCTGCRCCADVCPKECISFKKDSEGFFYPSVDESACISCSICKKVCPAFEPSFNARSSEAVAAFATDPISRHDGSSGGVFGLLSRLVLSEGGKVWGAAFDDNLKLKHASACTPEGLKPLMRSKYIQSDTTGVFRQIEEDLRNGIPTLFSGTPCQCNALLNAVKLGREKLVTVEVVCHGVPSQDLFDRTIAWWEEKHRCKVNSFTFRSKPVGALHPQAYSVEYACGSRRKTKHGLHYQFPYYFGFQKYITLRPSCYNCRWATPERCADITLADFWGIEKFDNNLNAKEGVSAILINTEKGKSLLDKLKDKGMIESKTFPIECLLSNNGCLSAPTKLKPEREAFFAAIGSQPFNDVIQRYLKPRRKWIFDLYYGMPGFLRKIVRRLMDKRMKYE